LPSFDDWRGVAKGVTSRNHASLIGGGVSYGMDVCRF